MPHEPLLPPGVQGSFRLQIVAAKAMAFGLSGATTRRLDEAVFDFPGF